MNTRLFLLLLVLLLELLPARSFAAYGFGIYSSGCGSDKRLTPFLDGFRNYSTTGAIQTVAVQPDGRIIIGGDFTLTRGGVSRQYLARINPDGSLDTDLSPLLLNGAVSAITIQPDLSAPLQPDLIIIGGRFRFANGNARNGLARISSADGSLDGFNPVPAATPVDINVITLQPDGKSILAGGRLPIAAGVQRPYFARISVNASDTGALNWIYSGEITGESDKVEVNAILVQGDGRILVAGNFTTSGPANIARLTDSGRLDVFSPPALGGTVQSLALQIDGQILIGGDFSGGQRNYLARLKGDDGTLDTTFNPNPDGYVASIAVQPDGKILVAGKFGQIGSPRAGRNYLARLDFVTGKVDSSLDPKLDAAGDHLVNSIALQPDGKILAGGNFTKAGGKGRSSLARFYTEGTLDDDIPADLALNAAVHAMSQHPDGTITVAGIFSSIQSLARKHIARLKGDWSLDTAFNPALSMDSWVMALAPLPDKSLYVGGDFWFVPAMQKLVVRVDPDGNTAIAESEAKTFNGNIKAYMTDLQAQAMALPAPGTLPEDKTVYIGGNLINPAAPYNLARYKNNGWRDDGFTPLSNTNGQVNSILLQGDKILVGTEKGKILRLNSNGSPDGELDLGFDSVSPATRQLNVGVYSITQQSDGGIIATGETNTRTPFKNEGTWQRNILRISADGTIDDSFVIKTMFSSEFPAYSIYRNNIYRVALQADGSMLIYGVFDKVMDAKGHKFCRDSVARITAAGELDPYFDLGPFTYNSSTPINNVSSIGLQPDGKIILGGAFRAMNGLTSKNRLVRFSYGSASQSLSIKADPSPSTNSTIRWQRTGGGPELWRVWFEYSYDPEATDWTFLGNASRTADGWQWPLDKLKLDDWRANINPYVYVRARGYTAGEKGSAGSLVQSVLLYYAKQQVTQKPDLIITANNRTKSYGQTTTWTGTEFTSAKLRAGDAIDSVSFSSTGAAAGAGAAGSPYTIIPASASGARFDAGNYNTVTYRSGDLTVSPAPLTVTADGKTRAYGAANPQLTASYTGFVNGDDASKILGSPVLWTDATKESPVGSYDIEVSLGSLIASNYIFIPKTGTLTVIKSCQEIVFPPIGDRTFGDPPFEIRASACSGLGISFASSDPKVAQINGNLLTITGAGGVVITASQGGTGTLDRAPDVAQTVVVHRSGQALGFSSLAGKVLGDPPFALSATASSGLPVSYQSSEPSVAEVNGNTVTLKGAGTAVITARQPGNGNYNEALPISQPLTVASEGVAPLIAISTLPSGAVTANPVLNIMGAASDASGIASLTVNGADLTGRAALFSSAVPLSVGENSIEVAARDGAGNRTTETLSITLDAAAPEISLAAPADNSVSSAPFFTASGAVTPESEVTMGVNGSALQILSVTDGAFTGSGYLEPGVNTIEVSAALSGRVARVKRSVTLAPGKPSVAITVPVEDIRTEHESITMRGTVDGEGCSVVLDVAGMNFTPAVQAGGFQQVIALDHAGEFPITASVTDSGGNSSVAQRNIIRVDRIMGDLDGDGCVDIRDALAVLRISLGIDQATAGALAHGDVAPLVNGVPQPDGRIDVGDLLVLLRKVVGLVDF